MRDLARKCKDKLQTGKTYLQTIYLTKILYIEYIKDSQSSTV